MTERRVREKILKQHGGGNRKKQQKKKKEHGPDQEPDNRPNKQYRKERQLGRKPHPGKDGISKVQSQREIWVNITQRW